MELIIKSFQELTNEELYAILKARTDIFVVEQKCPYPELDNIDQRSEHLFYTENHEILSYLRIFWKDSHTAQIGRVIAPARGKGYGLKILHEGVEYAKKIMHADTVYLEAQVYAIPFYEKEKFVVRSEPFDEDGILHVKMEKKL